MAERKIVVPEGMLEAAMTSPHPACREVCTNIIEAALRWLSENPIVPSVEQCDAIRDVLGPREDLMQWQVKEVAFEWQRRMFLAPEPEGVDDLLVSTRGCSISQIDDRIREAYRRGLKVGKL